jgi:hypothetical protein
MAKEARLEELSSGLAPATAGWFIVNVRDTAWETGPFGAGCFFESEAAPFAELGINLRVLLPGIRDGCTTPSRTRRTSLSWSVSVSC